MSQPNGIAPKAMKISWGMLRESIAIYLELAYPNGAIPAPVQKRLALDEGRPISEALGAPPFESYVAKAPFRCMVYALRLGSADYPNLKMEIRPFPHSLGFVFWVNTHDEFVPINATMRDADQWRDLMRRNRDLKQQVERAWSQRQLPTFTSAMLEETPPTDT
jgi:hypothetical protein